MSRFLKYWGFHLPYFFEVFAVGLLLAVLLTIPVARLVRLPRFLVLGLLASLALVVAATLTPDASSGITDGCITQLISPLPTTDLQELDQRTMNTGLFVPLGFFVGLALVRGRWWILGAAAALPFLIEVIQLNWAAVHRSCQFQDLVDNLWGLALGCLIGGLLGLAGDWRGQPAEESLPRA